VKGGVIGGTDKSTGALQPGTLSYVTYGGSSDLWGQTWTPADINASDFGLAFATQIGGKDGTTISNYLKITGFSFTVPSDATITGITAEVKTRNFLGRRRYYQLQCRLRADYGLLCRLWHDHLDLQFHEFHQPVNVIINVEHK
jgi:hypothetical protein